MYATWVGVARGGRCRLGPALAPDPKGGIIHTEFVENADGTKIDVIIQTNMSGSVQHFDPPYPCMSRV
jgi:hypothetical protein